MANTNLNMCPHCRSKEGYYTKVQVSGSVRYKQNFDGSDADNRELYDYLRCKGGKIAYCITCDKKLFSIDD